MESQAPVLIDKFASTPLPALVVVLVGAVIYLYRDLAKLQNHVLTIATANATLSAQLAAGVQALERLTLRLESLGESAKSLELTADRIRSRGDS